MTDQPTSRPRLRRALPTAAVVVGVGILSAVAPGAWGTVFGQTVPANQPSAAASPTPAPASQPQPAASPTSAPVSQPAAPLTITQIVAALPPSPAPNVPSVLALVSPLPAPPSNANLPVEMVGSEQITNPVTTALVFNVPGLNGQNVPVTAASVTTTDFTLLVSALGNTPASHAAVTLNPGNPLTGAAITNAGIPAGGLTPAANPAVAPLTAPLVFGLSQVDTTTHRVIGAVSLPSNVAGEPAAVTVPPLPPAAPGAVSVYLQALKDPTSGAIIGYMPTLPTVTANGLVINTSALDLATGLTLVPASITPAPISVPAGVPVYASPFGDGFPIAPDGGPLATGGSTNQGGTEQWQAYGPPVNGYLPVRDVSVTPPALGWMQVSDLQ